MSKMAKRRGHQPLVAEVGAKVGAKVVEEVGGSASKGVDDGSEKEAKPKATKLKK